MKMKNTIFALGAVAAISLYGISTAIAAEEMPETAKKAGCTACHAIDKKVVGPAWAWVASKYKGDKNGKDAIIHQIVNGGKGKWTKYTGGVPMPPYGPRTTEEQRNELADFILSLTPMEPPAK